jgi:hypothetical protein
MNKDDARERARQKALDELHAKQFVEGRDLRFYGAGFDKGFDAGAASVDRVAVVREAVNEVNKRLDAIEKHRTIRLADYDKAMDAVLAEMEVKNANS